MSSTTLSKKLLKVLNLHSDDTPRKLEQCAYWDTLKGPGMSIKSKSTENRTVEAKGGGQLLFNNVGAPNIIYVDKKPGFKIKHNKQNMDSPLKHQDRFTLMDYQFNQQSSHKKLPLPQEHNGQRVMVWQRKNLLKSQYLLI